MPRTKAGRALLTEASKDLRLATDERNGLSSRIDAIEAEAAALAGSVEADSSLDVERPRIVCLCGSTRFYSAFQRANYEETMTGRIVLSVGFYPHSAPEAHGEDIGVTPEQKAALDELHLRKIDLADEVLVLNQGGYIGESTRREIAHAEATGKPVRYLEPPAAVAARSAERDAPPGARRSA